MGLVGLVGLVCVAVDEPELDREDHVGEDNRATDVSNLATTTAADTDASTPAAPGPYSIRESQLLSEPPSILLRLDSLGDIVFKQGQ